MKYKCDYELVKGYKADSGFDVRCSYDFTLKPFEVKNVSTSLFLKLYRNMEAQVRPKSSVSAMGVLVHFGTVDSGYRGEILVTMQNLNNHDVTFSKGQKIAQIVFSKKAYVNLHRLEEIEDDTERGKGGFGSTGKF